MAAPGACSHSGRDPTLRAPTPRGRWTQEGALPVRSGCCRGWSWKCPLSAMDRRVFKPCFSHVTCLPVPRSARLRCRANCPSVLPPPSHRHGLKQPRVRHPTGCRRVDPLTSLGSGLFPGVSEKEAATMGVQVAPGSSGPLPPSLGNQLLGLRAKDPAGPCPPCPRPQACAAPVGRSRPGLMWPRAALTSGFGTGQPQGLPGQRLPGLRFCLPTAYKAPWAAAAWSGDECFITEFFPNKEPTESAMPGGCQGWRLSTCLPPATQLLTGESSGGLVFFSEVSFLQGAATKKLQLFPMPTSCAWHLRPQAAHSSSLSLLLAPPARQGVHHSGPHSHLLLLLGLSVPRLEQTGQVGPPAAPQSTPNPGPTPPVGGGHTPGME